MRLKSEEKILKSAKALFWAHGIKKVSVEEICEGSGVSKMTFYRKFKNKIEVAQTILAELMDEGVERFKRLIDSDISFEEKMEKIVLMKLEGVKDISPVFMKELIDHDDPEMGVYLVKRQQESMKLFMDWCQAAQDNGDIRADMNIHLIPFFSQTMGQMLADPNALQVCGGDLEKLVREVLNFFNHGICHKTTT